LGNPPCRLSLLFHTPVSLPNIPGRARNDHGPSFLRNPFFPYANLPSASSSFHSNPRHSGTDLRLEIPVTRGPPYEPFTTGEFHLQSPPPPCFSKQRRQRPFCVGFLLHHLPVSSLVFHSNGLPETCFFPKRSVQRISHFEETIPTTFWFSMWTVQFFLLQAVLHSPLPRVFGSLLIPSLLGVFCTRCPPQCPML